MNRVAVILIDCQKAFTRGCWAQCTGSADDTAVIRASFSRCASLVRKLPEGVPLLLTRCLFFRQQDMEFENDIADALKNRVYTEVVKPNTRIMDFDPQGVTHWIQTVKADGVSTVVIGGCTVTSCVRESSVQLQNCFGTDGGLRFVVDLSLCGARDANYVKRCRPCLQGYLEGCSQMCTRCGKSGDVLVSPVDKAVADMCTVGVTVMDTFSWSDYINV